MASMAKAQWDALTPVSELVSLAIFAYLVGLAAWILVPDGRWLTWAAVLGDSVAVLLAARVVHADSPAWLMVGTGAVPVALFAAAVGGYLYSRGGTALNANHPHPLPLSQRERGDLPLPLSFSQKERGDLPLPLALSQGERGAFRTDAQIGFLFTLLGVTAFSTIVALGLVAAQAIAPLEAGRSIALGDVVLVLQRLSVLVAMTGVPLLAGGLTVIRGSRRDKELAAYHLAGTVVALVAMLVMLAALAVAWPAPGWLIAVAVLNTMALAFAAFRWRLPVLHSGAIACAALAYLTAFYLSIGELTFSAADPYGAHLLRLMFNARSGTALAGLFLVLAALSELLARMGRSRHAVIYLGGCGVVAAAGLLLVTVHGVWTGGIDAGKMPTLHAIDAGKMPTLHADALRAAILYAVYGAGRLTARWRRLGLSYLGLVLVASAALWALWWQSAAQHVGPLWGAVLAIEGLVMAAMAAVLHRYAKGTWHDPWKMVEEAGRVGQARQRAGPPICGRWAGSPRPAGGCPELVPPYNYPRSQGLSLADLYRIPLAHVGEAAAMLAAA